MLAEIITHEQKTDQRSITGRHVSGMFVLEMIRNLNLTTYNVVCRQYNVCLRQPEHRTSVIIHHNQSTDR